MLRVGLTGGIGSGKSTIAGIFEVLGVPVYYADVAARNLMNTDEELKESIRRHFGGESYQNGVLNRAYLASIVFGNKEKLDLLNSLTHPATIHDANEWMKKQTSPYAIKEAALIFESGSAEFLDFVIGVSAPVAMRIKRTMKRDMQLREEVQKRMSRQLDEEMKMQLCDAVIMNDERRMVIPQVLKLHERLMINLAI
ncbi:MAG TPA: dephospho-CoA kinase [Chitinophagaceae bacterium]|nr:dephospho-CoA kinase [Chitinophagaceae bacterium]